MSYQDSYPRVHTSSREPFMLSAARPNYSSYYQPSKEYLYPVYKKPVRFLPHREKIKRQQYCSLICYGRITRTLVTGTCIGIFLYLTVLFFEMYSEYPTTVDVEVEFPNMPQMPAITICSANLYRKSVLCGPRPDICLAMESWQNKTDVLKSFTRRSEAHFLRKLAHQESRFFKECKFISESSPRNYSGCLHPTWYFLLGKPCFVMENEWTFLVEKGPKKNDTQFQMILDLQPDEYLDPAINPSAEVYIHSRQEIPDSRSEHFAARGGKSYEIGVAKTTIVMLEPPYVTQCKNYTKEYLKLNPEDSRSKKKERTKDPNLESFSLGETVCETSCRTKAALAKHKCIPLCLPFSNSSKKCAESIPLQKKKCASLKEEREKCFEFCPVECEVELYDIEIDEEDGFSVSDDEESSETNTTASSVETGTNFTRVTINLQLIRHSFYIHRPKVTPIEILGYIGGYLGIFLGISIPMLYDTLLKSITFCVEFAKRKEHSLRHRLQLD